MPTLDEYAAEFTDEPGYLDFATVAPIGEAAMAEERAQSLLLSTARFGSLTAIVDQEDRVDAAIAALLGVAPEQVVFQPSTSQALMHVAFGLTGGIALSRGEHPATSYAVARAADALGVLHATRFTPDHDRVTPASIADALTGSVAAVAVSAVDDRTGHLVDLDGIRQVMGDRLLIVDASQALGVVEAPWEAADVVVGTGRTWLRAGYGTGFLALSDRAAEQLVPVWSGWLAAAGGHGEDRTEQVSPPTGGARAYRVGYADPTAQARLAGAAEEVATVGVAAIRERVLATCAQIIELADFAGLNVVSPRDDAERAGIVVIEPPSGAITALTAALHNHGITAATIGGAVRLSAHVSTREDTLDLLRLAFAEFQNMSVA
ncbi:aminotransferase class V-fold PLP-dependent enzyme [Microcella sp.]|uniref:aminotransferase class V-fold PLP-dependent enzyme n=1 Tax=Microcella sp. TaxID=1913979 RepID=UPI00391B18E4